MSQRLEFKQWGVSGPLTSLPVSALSTTRWSASRHSIPFPHPYTLLSLSSSLSPHPTPFSKPTSSENLLLASLLPIILLIISTRQGGSRRETQEMPRVPGWCLWVQASSQTLLCLVASPREKASNSLVQHIKILKASLNSICPVRCFLKSVHFIYK